MSVRAWRSSRRERQAVLLHLLPAALMIGFSLCGPYMMGLSLWVNPASYDGLAYAADQAFGQPSFVLGQWFEAFPLLRFVCLSIYASNALTFVFIYLVQIRQTRLPAIDIFPSIVLAASLIGPLY